MLNVRNSFQHLLYSCVFLFCVLFIPFQTVHAALSWGVEPATEANEWRSIAWSQDLGTLVAVSVDGTNRVMISNDGTNWTAATAAEANGWTSVTWASELGIFVAVANSGTNRVMTSIDGVNWFPQSAPASGWSSVIWTTDDGGKFVAVADSGANRVMTSPNGETWTAQSAAAATLWRSVTYSPELDLFVAVSQDGGSNKVMTSPDGVTWTLRSTPSNNDWWSVTWSPEVDLFVAVLGSGSQRVMTSPDGITWTARTAPTVAWWNSVVWSPERRLFAAVGGTGDAMTSADGITWTAVATAEDNDWQAVTWSPSLGIFIGVGKSGTNRVVGSSGFIGTGAGTGGDPYLVSNCAELHDITFVPTSQFSQTGNIDCSATTTWFEDPGNPGTFLGFNPIEDFEGIYDGNEFTISNLYINRENDSNIGLFGNMESGASITDLNLEQVDITGEELVGGLVGESDGGTITNVSLNGSVTGLGEYTGGLVAESNNTDITNSHTAGSVTGIAVVGGLVGEHDGGTIADSYSTATVNAGANGGGLVGDNYSPIVRSYATGDITEDDIGDGVFGNCFGGLVAYSEGDSNTGAITDSYATGDVHVVDTTNFCGVGGLVGSIEGGPITTSYSTGAVISDTTPESVGSIGGFVGNNQNATFTNSFWDVTTSTRALGCGTVSSGCTGATGKTTAEMKAIATFQTATWDIGADTTNNLNSGYPFLSWQVDDNSPVWFIYEGAVPTATPTTGPTATSAPAPQSNNSTAPSGGSPSAPSCGDTKPGGTADLFQIDVNNTQATLYFAPVSNADKYYISYGEGETTERHGVEFDSGRSTGVLSFTINELIPNRSYSFKVRAGNGCMPGDWSNIMQAKTRSTASGGTTFYKNFLSRLLSVFPREIDYAGSGSASTPEASKTSSNSSCEYIVKSGDSLWSIASEQLGSGTEYSTIMKENNLSSKNLKTGQKLKVGC